MLQTYLNNLLLKRGTTEVLDDDVDEDLRGNAKKVSKFWVKSNFGIYPIQNCKKKYYLYSLFFISNG